MRNYLSILVVFFISIQLAACNAETVKVEGFSAPESVTSDGTFFYVSNVGEKLKPMDRDGDGYISKLTSEGGIIERRFISGLDAPKGMVVLKGVLYVNDIDRLKGFNLADGRKVFDLDFSSEGTSFLNGITLMDDEMLLISAMDTGSLYMVDTSASPGYKKVECDSDLFGPNGLSFDSKTETIYFCSFGKDHKPNGIVGSGRIENNKFSFERINPGRGFYDGMVYHEGEIIFSDWVDFGKKGVLIRQNIESGESSVLNLGEKIGGPADFYLDEKGKRLWIPMMMENKILIVGLR